MSLDPWTFARGLVQLEREEHPDVPNIEATAGHGLTAEHMNLVVKASERYSS